MCKPFIPLFDISAALFPMVNLVNHPFHGTDPAKYGVQAEPSVLESYEGLRPGEILRRKKEAVLDALPKLQKDE
jgi:hypothetical protein